VPAPVQGWSAWTTARMPSVLLLLLSLMMMVV